LIRCQQRNYSLEDVESIILQGDVIEISPNAKPLPKCLIMKKLNDEPVYVAIAYNDDTNYAYILTVHGHDPKKWSDPQTRKQL